VTILSKVKVEKYLVLGALRLIKDIDELIQVLV